MRMKRNSIIVHCFVIGIVLLCMQACASSQKKRAADYTPHVYNKSYDEVWDALVGVITDELGCALKKEEKKKGELETEWVHVFDTEGTLRWMLACEVKEQDGGVVVYIDKRVQMHDEKKKQMNHYRRKKESRDAMDRSASWKDYGTDEGSVNSMYQSLEGRLNEE